jgi:diphthine-ammonia ligase
MRVGILFSGGKDSAYALQKAAERGEEVACLVTLESLNPESYMFHTPNISLTSLQAQSIGLPLVKKSTEGGKEDELDDLEDALRQAKERYGIEAAVTGAVESVYQAERIQRVCDRLGLWCFNPLWKCDQAGLLTQIVESGYEVIVSGVFAYPMGEEWLGRRLDKAAIGELIILSDRYRISPAGEGGEIETTVLDAPYFRRRVEVLEAKGDFRGTSGVYRIGKAHLVEK